MGERFLAGLVVVPFLLGAAAAPVGHAQVVFSFQDDDIVESSGLAVVDGLVVTTNDSGDTGRVFAVDPADGRTVSVTDWEDDPTDVEALAPDGRHGVWVGDIGDNTESRDTIQVAELRVSASGGTVEPHVYDLAYPDGPHNAETMMTDPATGRLYIATKETLGGTLYAVPPTLNHDGTTVLEPLGDVLPIATDGAFLPDGRHFVVRNYFAAAVYAFPSLEKVDELSLPSQPQGEGLAVEPDGRLLLSSEGLHSDVLQISLPAGATPAPSPSAGASASPSAGASAGATSSASPPPRTESHEDSELPDSAQTERPAWPWFLSGLIAIGFILVLSRSLRRPQSLRRR